MKNLIVTASDSKYGDFLINHWLKSLKENVNLINIDILILDYGLSKDQIEKFDESNIIVKKCERDCHVTTARHRDLADFLKNNKYNQILSSDSGDIIFQSDFAKIFEENKNSFRAVIESYNPLDYESKIFLKKDKIKSVGKFLKGKPLINAGIIFGPADKFIELCENVYNIIENKSVFGPDQVAVNYFLHSAGFVQLPEIYNFVIGQAKQQVIIKEGRFYINENVLIPIVHNAGGSNIFRSVDNFGYGKSYNQIKAIPYKMIRSFGKIKRKINNYNLKISIHSYI